TARFQLLRLFGLSKSAVAVPLVYGAFRFLNIRTDLSRVCHFALYDLKISVHVRTRDLALHASITAGGSPGFLLCHPGESSSPIAIPAIGSHYGPSRRVIYLDGFRFGLRSGLVLAVRAKHFQLLLIQGAIARFRVAVRSSRWIEIRVGGLAGLRPGF